MSSHFSANQYEDAFNPKKLINWTVPRKHKERPSTLEGFTQIIANDRGHLKPGVPKSKESPWGTFMGTWDMPRNIPPARPSYTARSNRAASNLLQFKESSPLNTAVNGYKEFGPKKSIKDTKKESPVERPSAPSPPKSKSPIQEAIDPSAGVKEQVEQRVSSRHSEARSLPPTPVSEKAISRTQSVTSIKERILTPDSGRPESIASLRYQKSPEVEIC